MANTSKGRSLGDFFSAYTFPEEETERIAALAAEKGSIAAHIITRYITRTDFYQSHFVKREKIPGCRPGSPLYKQRAIHRIVSYLRKSAGDPHRGVAVGLYRRAASLFIEEELANLNKLLTENQVSADAPSATDALRTVCSRALDFGVTAEHITKFYEVWGIPRVDGFKDALPAWMEADEAHLQKRQISSLTIELSALRTELREVTAGLASKAASLEQDRQRAITDRQRLHAHGATLETFSERLTGLRHGTEAVEPRIKALEERTALISEKLTQAQRAQLSRQDLKADLHKLETTSKAAIGHASEATAAALGRLLQEDIQSLRVEFESKLAAHIAELSKIKEARSGLREGAAVAAAYRSPLSGFLSHVPNPNSLTNEIAFVSAWKQHLSQSFDVVVSIEEAFAYHRALLANAVVICDRALAQSWIDCLGWHSSTMHLAASPTWSDEADWAQGAEYIFTHGQDLPPRFVVIHNYDVGLTDCYLTPSLALWGLRQEPRPLSKIFLLPSSQEHALSSLLLEHAISCTVDVPLAPSLSLRTGVRVPTELHRNIPMGVEPALAARWAQQLGNVDYDLSPLQRALKCRISPSIVSNFRQTISFAARFLDDSSSIGLALHHQLAPWVHATYGDDKFSAFELFLKHIPASGY
jgi:hypothetical protein